VGSASYVRQGSIHNLASRSAVHVLQAPFHSQAVNLAKTAFATAVTMAESRQSRYRCRPLCLRKAMAALVQIVEAVPES